MRNTLVALGALALLSAALYLAAAGALLLLAKGLAALIAWTHAHG